AVGTEQRQLHRNRHGLLVRLPRAGWGVLRQRERVFAARGVVFAVRLEPRRAGLAVPGKVGREVDTVRLAQRSEEILDGGGAAVVAAEVQVGAAAEAGRAQP